MLFLPAIPGNPYLRSAFWMPGEAREIQFFSDLGACQLRNQRITCGPLSDPVRLVEASVPKRPSTFVRRMSASASKPLMTSAARRSLSLKVTERGLSPMVSSSAVETVSFSLTMGKTPNAISLSIVRRRLEYRCQLLKSSSVSKTRATS